MGENIDAEEAKRQSRVRRTPCSLGGNSRPRTLECSSHRCGFTETTAAMPSSTVGDVRRAAVVALLDVATEHGCPTRGDGAHHAPSTRPR